MLCAAWPSQWPDESLPEVVMAGRSNVGKSSFINTVTNVQGLAKVSSTPGKTRTLNFFNINDEVFAENSWYFRNSLVRANYKNFEKNVFEDTSFLEKFFYNLLTNANNELKNRCTHIDNIQSAENDNLKCNNYTLEEQAIINILKTNPATTQEEISRQINKSVRTVKTYMAEMQEKGLIERKNGKKNGEWQVNE